MSMLISFLLVAVLVYATNASSELSWIKSISMHDISASNQQEINNFVQRKQESSNLDMILIPNDFSDALIMPANQLEELAQSNFDENAQVDTVHHYHGKSTEIDFILAS